MPDLSVIDYSLIGLAGLVVGFINAVAGGSSVIVYTLLIALGINPLSATVTTGWGVTPANLIAQKASTQKLSELYRNNYKLLWWSIIGTVIGAIALLNMPLQIIEKSVPVFLLIAGLSVLIPVQREVGGLTKTQEQLAIFGTGIYCGYFGPGQGVLVAATLARDPRRIPIDLAALKNFITGYTSIVSNLIFLTSGRIVWAVVATLAITSGIGGWYGAKAVGRMSPLIYRGLLLAVGIGGAIWFFIKFW